MNTETVNPLACPACDGMGVFASRSGGNACEHCDGTGRDTGCSCPLCGEYSREDAAIAFAAANASADDERARMIDLIDLLESRVLRAEAHVAELMGQAVARPSHRASECERIGSLINEWRSDPANPDASESVRLIIGNLPNLPRATVEGIAEVLLIDWAMIHGITN